MSGPAARRRTRVSDRTTPQPVCAGIGSIGAVCPSQTVLETRHKQTCDLHMLKAGRSKFPASLESIATPETRGLGEQCWIVLIDLTAQQQMEEDLHRLTAELANKVQTLEATMGELTAMKDDLAE